MSMATVRIAPVERWCEATEPRRDDGEVGREIEIETASMSLRTACQGRNWIVSERTAQLLEQLHGVAYARPLWICEHMLRNGLMEAPMTQATAQQAHGAMASLRHQGRLQVDVEDLSQEAEPGSDTNSEDKPPF